MCRWAWGAGHTQALPGELTLEGELHKQVTVGLSSPAQISHRRQHRGELLLRANLATAAAHSEDSGAEGASCAPPQTPAIHAPRWADSTELSRQDADAQARWPHSQPACSDTLTLCSPDAWPREKAGMQTQVLRSSHSVCVSSSFNYNCLNITFSLTSGELALCFF